MSGNDLSVPLSNNLYGQLEKMISAEQIKCIEVVDDMVQKAKEQGQDFKEDLTNNKEIRELKESLDFFNRHGLFTGTDKLF